MDELQKMFDQKVDKKYIKNKIEGIKASRNELNQAMMIIQKLHTRVSHLAMMQVEISKTMCPLKSTSSTAAETV